MAEAMPFQDRFKVSHYRLSWVLLGFIAQDDGELGFAGVGGIIEGGAFAVGGAIALVGAEEESLFGVFGEADEAGFAVGVGADGEVEFVEIHESIGNVDADVGGVEGLAGFVCDDEIGGAGAEAGIDFGDGFGVGFGGGRLGGRRRHRERKNREGEKRGEGGSE
jgi:hypothetical protein